jgi:hypothetical protein
MDSTETDHRLGFEAISKSTCLSMRQRKVLLLGSTKRGTVDIETKAGGHAFDQKHLQGLRQSRVSEALSSNGNVSKAVRGLLDGHVATVGF